MIPSRGDKATLVVLQLMAWCFNSHRLDLRSSVLFLICILQLDEVQMDMTVRDAQCSAKLLCWHTHFVHLEPSVSKLQLRLKRPVE